MVAFRWAAGGTAALCAGVLLLPLALGTGRPPSSAAWQDACTPTAAAQPVADSAPSGTSPAGAVTVALNPQGAQSRPHFDSEQQRSAKVITDVARSRGLRPRAAVIAVATAMQESSLRNIAHGDRDSLGLFQQRPSQGWGTPAQVADPVYASNQFYDRLIAISDWEVKPLTRVAQSIQRSGHPDAYAKWEAAAGALVVSSWGSGAVLTSTSGCDPVANAANSQGGAWALPVENSHVGTPYGAGGGAWSSGRHTGIDFPVATGTRIQSVGSGTVVEAGWGGAYGNNIVIKMNDGKYTQYGHLSTITVSAGQTVHARDQLGLSGATGNVSGPHLHFEARNGPAYGSDIDPVAYLRGHNLTL